jgi:hypothetical protein
LWVRPLEPRQDGTQEFLGSVHLVENHVCSGANRLGSAVISARRSARAMKYGAWALIVE